jgi:hypothetical protein
MTYSNNTGSSVTFPQATQIADSNGKVQWDGSLNIRAYVGKTKLEVKIESGGKTATFTTYFEIVSG